MKLSYKIGLSLSVLNEFVTLLVFLLYAYKITINKQAIKLSSAVLLCLGFFSYMVLLAFYRGIMPLSMIQILIYIQFFFFFFYFHHQSFDDKNRTVILLKNILDSVLIIVFITTLIEFIDRSSFRDFIGVHDVNRGINGFYLVSFFGSGPSLGIFCMLYVVVWHYYHYAKNIKTKRRDVIYLIGALIIGTLSFSRKEVLLMFLFIVFFPYPTKSTLKLWIKRFVFGFGAFLMLIIYYLTFFESANSKGFSGDYVRWKIANKAVEIYSDYASFGTGAGTFGSKMSLTLDHIYKKYEIGQAMLGWEASNSRGPIYDSFMFTLFTEIGIGILFVFLFFFFILNAKPLTINSYSKYIKRFLIFVMFTLSFFIPMLTNSFGFIIISFLACIITPISIFKINLKLN